MCTKLNIFPYAFFVICVSSLVRCPDLLLMVFLFFIYSDSLCLLIAMFIPYVFIVITDIVGLISSIVVFNFFYNFTPFLLCSNRAFYVDSIYFPLSLYKLYCLKTFFIFALEFALHIYNKLKSTFT